MSAPVQLPGLITPLGFAALAGATPAKRIGQTMGAAELGRELGDAGGPLIVSSAALAVGLGGGFLVLAVMTTMAVPLVDGRSGRSPRPGSGG